MSADANTPKDESEMTSEEWDAAYDRISDELGRYQERVLAKHDSGQPMTEAEQTVFHCWGFWSVANVNSGDIFGNLEMVIGHEKKFEAIGAKGTLEAKEKLLPLYQEMMAKPTDDDRWAFWRETRERRQEDEDLAEGCVGFGQLLLDYARKHDGEIDGGGTPALGSAPWKSTWVSTGNRGWESVTFLPAAEENTSIERAVQAQAS